MLHKPEYTRLFPIFAIFQKQFNLAFFPAYLKELNQNNHFKFVDSIDFKQVWSEWIALGWCTITRQDNIEVISFLPHFRWLVVSEEQQKEHLQERFLLFYYQLSEQIDLLLNSSLTKDFYLGINLFEIEELNLLHALELSLQLDPDLAGSIFSVFDRAYELSNQNKKRVYLGQKVIDAIQNYSAMTSSIVQLYNNILFHKGLALLQEGKVEESIEAFLAILEKADIDSYEDSYLQRFKALIHQNLGVAFLSLKQFEKSEAHFTIALHLLEPFPEENRRVNEIYHNLGIIERDDLQQSQHYLELALQSYQASEEFISVGEILFNLGNLFNKKKEYQQAKEYYYVAIDIFIAFNDSLRLKAVLQSLGIVYKKLDQMEDALTAYRQALRIAITLEDKTGEADLFFNIGNIFKDKREYEDSINYFEKALVIFRDHQHEHATGQVFLGLGEVYSLLNNFASSRTFYQKAHSIFTKVGDSRLAKDSLMNLQIVEKKLQQS